MEIKRFLKIFESKTQYEELKNEIMDIPHTVLFDDSNEIFIQKTPFEKKYFTIESLDKGRFTINLPQPYKFKFNNGEWIETSGAVMFNMEIGDTIQISHVADVVKQQIIETLGKFNVYGNIMSLLYGDNFEGQTELSENNYIFQNLFKNCTTLQSAENLILPATTLAPYCYRYMFMGCTILTEAPALPATTLANYCYSYMFDNCTSLVTAPELPATTLASYCYESMFSYCTSLVTAPELLATTLANYCYSYMFDFCKSLVTAPELSATTLANHCYNAMFRGCTSLVTAPELPAKTLVEGCYNGMFYDCSKLNYIKMLAININATNCLNIWVNGVAERGTFVKNKDATWDVTGASGIPSGWTRKIYDGVNEVIDYNYEYFTIEALGNGTVGIGIPTDATSLKYRKNDEIWIETSEAIQVSVVTNDTIQISCLSNSFNNNCSSPFNISASFNVKGNIMSLLYEDNFANQIDLSGRNYVFNSLFYQCTTLQSAENLILPATTLADYCYYYMFSNCTSLTTSPQLLATTLARECYYGMFRNCTSLTTAPELPATTLARECYSNMFYGTNVLPDCSNIDFTNEAVVASGGLRGLFAGTKVTDGDLEQILPKNEEGKYCLPTTTLADGCYGNMFNSCTSLKTAPVLPATTLTISCYGYMFAHCTSLTEAPQLLVTTLARACYQYMFQYCTSLTTAPELPATTLASYCYDNMFNNCTSLTEAPALHATTLAEGCYSFMFQGCSKLNYIKMLATDISATNCLSNWVRGVASSGTFVKNAAMTSLPTATSSNYYKGIPTGWSVEDNVEQLNGYEYVDLGLPSGTLWAKCDYGANSETDDGLYFSRLNSVNGLPSSQIPDDIPSGNFKSTPSVVESQEDAIPKLMGDGWSMPKNSDIEELIENTNQEMTEINGVEGTKFINRNYNTQYIFFPYSEYNYGTYVCWLNDVYTHGDNTTSPSRFMTMFDAQKSNYHFTHIGYQTFGARANRYRGIIRKK